MRRAIRCRPATIGRLAVKGPIGCRYLDDPQRQQAYVKKGWNITGDAFHVDEDGFYWYHSRTDDMIVSSGYNISGSEIEEVLLEHPAVKECAVVGVADGARGQIAKAFIVPRDMAQGGWRADAGAAGLREEVDRAVQISARHRIRRRSCRAPRPARCSARHCGREAEVADLPAL